VEDAAGAGEDIELLAPADEADDDGEADADTAEGDAETEAENKDEDTEETERLAEGVSA